MSLIDNLREDSGLPSVVLGILVVLLLLLASVIWVAFCMAVHRTAKRVAEYKRQRRRQHIISAAIGHAINQSGHSELPSILNSHYPVYIAEQGPAMLNDPPPYEEAIRLNATTLIKTSRRSLSQTNVPDTSRIFQNSCLLRIAPDRPLNNRIARNRIFMLPLGPPSYESAINSPESRANNPSTNPPTSNQRANLSRRQSVY